MSKQPGDPGRVWEQSSRGLFHTSNDLKNGYIQQKGRESQSDGVVLHPYGHNAREPLPAFQHVANGLYARQDIRMLVDGKGKPALPRSSVCRNNTSNQGRLHAEAEPPRPKDPGVRRGRAELGEGL